MKNKDIKELLNKCFGKNKDEKYHAIAMLIIYGIFISILVIMIRLGGTSSEIDSNDNNQGEVNSPTVTSTPNPTSTPEIEIDNEVENDINYSYSYTVTYNGVSEVYLGKRVDDKQKFTLIKDNVSTSYAIYDDNYLILEGDIYKITDNPSKFFKYCDVEKILVLLRDKLSVKVTSSNQYNVDNNILSSFYKEKLLNEDNGTNLISINMTDDSLKSIDLDFSSYISALEGVNSTLNIHMEFADVGTTENFEIKVS